MFFILRIKKILFSLHLQIMRIEDFKEQSLINKGASCYGTNK